MFKNDQWTDEEGGADLLDRGMRRSLESEFRADAVEVSRCDRNDRFHRFSTLVRM